MASTRRMNFGKVSAKHLQVDRAMTTVVVVSSIAAAVLVFSLIATKSLVNLIGYQRSVINLRNKAATQLQTNVSSTNTLLAAYLAFDGATESKIGTADKNSKIVLDALPSKYDFPALTTSLEGIVNSAGMSIKTIEGTDEEVTAQQSSLKPIPVEIKFSLTAEGSYESAQKLINDLQRSIRPFTIESIKLTANDNGMVEVAVTGKTAYQPSRELGINEYTVDKTGKLQKGGSSATSTAKPTTTGGN